MPTSRKNTIPEFFGVSAEMVEGEVRIRAPADPIKAQQAHDRSILVLKFTAWTTAGAFVLCFALCVLFLHYGKPEQAEKVVATVIGLIGGIGIGRGVLGKE